MMQQMCILGPGPTWKRSTCNGRSALVRIRRRGDRRFRRLVTAGIWVGGVNEHRRTVVAFMKEIRDDVKEILHRLEPV